MKGDKVKPFYLLREVDKTGTSGTGIVAMGAIYPSGAAYMEWTASNHVSWGFFNNIDDVVQLHSHGGDTKVILGNPDDKPKRKKKNEQT